MDFKIGDQVRWFPFGVGSRKRALWRGNIVGVDADTGMPLFKAPSWTGSIRVSEDQLERY